MSVRVQTGDTEQFSATVLKRNGDPALDRTTLRLRVLRKSDDQLLDFDDLDFKASGHVTLDETLDQLDKTNAPGVYELVGGFDTSALGNANPDDTYLFIVTQTSGNDLLPGTGEIVVGFWADDIAKIDTFPTLAAATAASGSLLDILVNKDGSKTYDPAIGSLEALGEGNRRLLGLLHQNAMVDKHDYDSNGQLLSARLRIFDTAANVPPTQDGSETIGLLFEYTFEATYAGLGLQNKWVGKAV